MSTTILLADDSITIRKVVELTFSDTDIRVEAVGTGSEAADLFESVRPDLVLADVVMPEPAGYELCRQIKSSDHPVPVLLLSGTFEDFDESRARECGADGHIVKPFESHALLQKVEALLHGPPALEPEPETEPPGAVERILDELSAEPAAGPETEATPEASVVGEPAMPYEAAPAHDATPSAAMAPPDDLTPAEEPATAPVQQAPGLSPTDIDEIARRVVAHLSRPVLQEIAWEVVPQLAETLIKERLRQLEDDSGD